jgi:hypothetical protein
MSITHFVISFDKAGNPLRKDTYRGTLEGVTKAAKRAHPRGTHSIDILNDTEGTRREGQIVRRLTRGADGKFHVRYGKQTLPNRPAPVRNPARGHHRAGAKAAAAKIEKLTTHQRATIKRIG